VRPFRHAEAGDLPRQRVEFRRRSRVGESLAIRCRRQRQRRNHGETDLQRLLCEQLVRAGRECGRGNQPRPPGQGLLQAAQ